MGVYIRTDMTRLTFRELWGISSNFFLFLAACVMKVLGVRTTVKLAVLHEDRIRVVSDEDVSPKALRSLEPRVEECEDAGAVLAFYQAVSGTGPLEGYAAVLLSPERNAVIVATWVTARPGGAGAQAHCAIMSHLQDNTFLATTDAWQRFIPEPGVNVFRYCSAGPTELMVRHQQHLREANFAPHLVENAAHAEQILLAAKRHNFEGKVRRGVWVPLTREERVRLGLPVDA